MVQEDDLGVDLEQPVEAEAAALEATGPHRLDDGVGPAYQIEEDLDALRGAQVEHDAALAPVGVQVQQRGALDDRPGHAAPVVTGRRLDLDHVGAEIGERARHRRRTEHGALDDAHPSQRPGRVVAGGRTAGDTVVRLIARAHLLCPPLTGYQVATYPRPFS